MELARLIDLTAERLGLSLEYDAAAVKGVVTLRVNGTLSNGELWDLTNRVLASRGFTTVRMQGGSGLSVVKLAEAKSLAAVIDESSASADGAVVGGGSTAYEPGFASVMLRVRHRAPKDVVEPAKMLLSKEAGGIATLGDSGFIVVSDLRPRVARARELITSLDAAAAAAVEEVPAKFLAPDQLAALAMQVAARRASAGSEALKGEVIASANGGSILIIAPPDHVAAWTELIERLDRREPVETVTYGARWFAPREASHLIEEAARGAPGAAAGDDRLRVVPDELTGALIVTATPAQHARIRQLVDRFEATGAGTPRPVRAFAIRNRPVSDVVLVLNQLVDSGALGGVPPDEPGAEGTNQQFTRAGGQGSETAPAAPQSHRSGASEQRTPGDSEPAARRRDGAHRPGTARPVELTADTGTNTLIAISDARTLGQLEQLLRTIDVRQPQVMMEVMLVSLTEAQGLQLGVEIEKLTNITNTRIRLASLFGLSSVGAGGRAVGDAIGFTGTALNPGEFSLVVRALQNMNNGRSLSAPQILVNNNQQAVLSSVLQQPFASTNASTTVATTSFGGTQDAGTTLTIRPQIAEGDHLVLEYSVALSSFVGTSGSAALPPPRQQNTAQSTVTIPDGYTVVVGGLELETESRSVTQVPVLGDVPLIGELFKSRDTSRTRSRFFVFIRAEVMRSSSFEDLKFASEARGEQMGIEDGFPEVEPRMLR